jgi:excisionase family DNA binding protein
MIHHHTNTCKFEQVEIKPQDGGPMPDKLLSVVAAAEYLGGISPWTVYAWLSQGKLARTKVGSRTMIRESEIERFVQKCESTKQKGDSQSGR